jgi:MOSC domain-containing protein YiiM
MRIGSDDGPLLELTDFATPCAKQARWFVDERIDRISSLIYPDDARWYASVIEDGPIAPGDRVELVPAV